MRRRGIEEKWGEGELKRKGGKGRRLRKERRIDKGIGRETQREQEG